MKSNTISTLKPCAFCGKIMPRRQVRNRRGDGLSVPESASSYAHRRVCNRLCRDGLKRRDAAAAQRLAAARLGDRTTTPDQMSRVGRALCGRLRALRIGSGLSQNKLADLLGISMQLYSAWECGRMIQRLQFEWIARLAFLFGISIAEMIGDLGIEATASNAPQQPARELKPQDASSPDDHSKCAPGSVRMCSECRNTWAESLREAV